jgi:hypothetical protein
MPAFFSVIAPLPEPSCIRRVPDARRGFFACGSFPFGLTEFNGWRTDRNAAIGEQTEDQYHAE